MTLTQTVDIPADRRVRFDFVIPREIPEGKTEVVIKFPVREKAQTEAVAAEKPKMNIPKDKNGKFILSKEIIDEMERNSPITQRLSGILSNVGDITAKQIREERLARKYRLLRKRKYSRQ